MEIAELTTWLGWTSLINIALLAVATIVLISMRGTIVGLHRGMFDLSEAELSRAYFQYLAQFKIVVLVFNVAPYLALKLMV